MQLTKRLGATMYATVSSEAKAEFVRKLGADKVIISTKTDFAGEIARETKRKGVNAIFDAIGGEVLTNRQVAVDSVKPLTVSVWDTSCSGRDR